MFFKITTDGNSKIKILENYVQKSSFIISLQPAKNTNLFIKIFRKEWLSFSPITPPCENNYLHHKFYRVKKLGSLYDEKRQVFRHQSLLSLQSLFYHCTFIKASIYVTFNDKYWQIWMVIIYDENKKAISPFYH